MLDRLLFVCFSQAKERFLCVCMSHKSLGLLVLASLLFRLMHIFGNVAERLISILYVLSPAVTTLVSFHIPWQRIDSGYRIWPKYRFHSLYLCVPVLGNDALWHMLNVMLAALSSPSPPQYLLEWGHLSWRPWQPRMPDRGTLRKRNPAFSSQLVPNAAHHQHNQHKNFLTLVYWIDDVISLTRSCADSLARCRLARFFLSTTVLLDESGSTALSASTRVTCARMNAWEE